mmetsp:Transcript_58263/g.103541  ORF Transcript_58263/g.103541 Transcript_58263/m.103541 type:complete len:567 (-) Transcript_58263:34-1734(-)
MMRFWVLVAVSLVRSAAISTRGHQEVAIGYRANHVREIRGRSDFMSHEVFPVPTTSRCTVIIIIGYMMVLAALAITRIYHELSGTPSSKLDASLKEASQALTHGPMICVLFIAYDMRVDFLTSGTGQPQTWAQHCIYGVTFATLGSSLAVLLLPLVFGRAVSLEEGSPSLAPFTPRVRDISKAILICLRYCLLFVFYGGLAGVLVGICVYTPPQYKFLEAPMPAPAISCTMVIAMIFFAIQLGMGVCRSITEFTGHDSVALLHALKGAASIMESGPMLCILFLAARMRALQHHAQPQLWAQACMIASTWALGLSALMAILMRFAPGVTVTVDPETNEAQFAVRHPIVGVFLLAFRSATVLSFYGGAVAVALSVFLFQAPAGPVQTLPISSTLQCVMILTVQFFAIYLTLMTMETVSDLSQGTFPLDSSSFYAALDAAKTTVQFAPMLAVLCVTTRMCALAITGQKGAPQPWVQISMFVATGSLLVSALACIATGLAVGNVEQDDDGNVVNKFENKALAHTMAILRYACMLMLYIGVAVIIIGLFVMTPGTAGQGSISLRIGRKFLY